MEMLLHTHTHTSTHSLTHSFTKHVLMNIFDMIFNTDKWRKEGHRDLLFRLS